MNLGEVELKRIVRGQGHIEAPENVRSNQFCYKVETFHIEENQLAFDPKSEKCHLAR